MKELLTAIIGKEEELKGRSDMTGRQAQSVIEAAKVRAEQAAADREAGFAAEKVSRTREVENAVKQYDDGLKKKLAADLKESGRKLDAARERIKTGIMKAMLEE